MKPIDAGAKVRIVARPNRSSPGSTSRPGSPAIACSAGPCRALVDGLVGTTVERSGAAPAAGQLERHRLPGTVALGRRQVPDGQRRVGVW